MPDLIDLPPYHYGITMIRPLNRDPMAFRSGAEASTTNENTAMAHDHGYDRDQDHIRTKEQCEHRHRVAAHGAVIKQNLFVSLGVTGFLVLTTTTGIFSICPAVFSTKEARWWSSQMRFNFWRCENTRNEKR